MPGAIIVPIANADLPTIKPSDFRQALPALLVGTFAGFGGYLFGYDTGVISGLLEMPEFGKEFGRYWDNVPDNTISADNPARPGYALSTSGRSLAVSILSVGTFFGALFAAPLGDWIGRRPAFMVAIAVFSIGILVQAVAHALGVFALGRVFAGAGVGLLSCLVPLYQAETAPRWIRGAVVTCYQWAITIGLLIASIVNECTKDNSGKSSYLIPICLQFIWAAILLTGLFFIPESPRFRVRQGRHEDAAKILAWLNRRSVDDPIIQAELKAVVDNYEEEKKVAKNRLAELLHRDENRYLDRVLLGAALQALQQLSGINFIFYYGTTFFKSTGAKNPFTFSVISNVVNVVSTVPGMYATEHFGRRFLFIGGAIGMFVCQLLVAIIGTASTVKNRDAQRAAVSFVCFYIAFFASTWGPQTWIWTSEVFPLQIRSTGLAISTASQWLLNFAIGYSTPYLVDKGKGKAGLGPKVFFIWSCFCLICVLVSYFCVHEPRGLSLEEVDELFKTSTARESVKRNAEIKANRHKIQGKPDHADAVIDIPSQDNKDANDTKE
ncbi:unnamed protein product [Sympodiomycopsis kandeliae]